MSIIAKSEKSLYKREAENERIPAIGFKNLQFAHKAAAGETTIDLNSLTTPGGSEWPYANPTASELAAAQLFTYQKNLMLYTSARGWLLPGSSFTVTSNSTISFTDDFGETLENEIFVGYLLNTARTGSLVADTDQILVTGELSAAQTTISVGKSFPINFNANEKVGWVLLYINGELKRRNVGNSSTTTDEDYYEPGTGTATALELNTPAVGGEKYIVVSSALATIRPDGSLTDELQRQAGVIDSLVETVALLAGVPEGNFQATPTQPVLKDFGDRVVALEGEKSSDTIAADGAFAGGNVIVEKNGKSITVTADAVLTHASLSSVATSGSFLPTKYRPTVDVTAVYAAGSVIRQITISTTGQITADYLDYAGAAANDVNIGTAFTISYNVG